MTFLARESLHRIMNTMKILQMGILILEKWIGLIKEIGQLAIEFLRKR